MELWTSEHIKTLLPEIGVMIVLAVILRLWLGKKDLSVRMIPLQIVACLLLLLEIGKQTVSLVKGYNLYHLPFHFCSLLLLALPVMAFYRGKHRQVVYGVVSALCASVFLLMAIYPNLIYPAGDVQNFFNGYFHFHTVVFHNLAMFSFMLIVALDPQGTVNTKREVKALSVFVAGFGVVAATMAHLLKTNYANMYTCNIPVLEELRKTVGEAIGTVPTQILYVTIVCVLQIGFTLMAYWFYRLVKYLLNGTRKEHDA
ncbi:MAG: YwaF family protein [Clostridia bacterium]|nr:YwaF family protein [Clostridia bacterium]MBQ9781503.1 YwaF family protein [Clostridia bacterium]